MQYLKRMSVAGILGMGCLNFSPKIRWVRNGGREVTGWLKLCPNVRGRRRELAGWLKSIPKDRRKSERGRESTGWLNKRQLGDQI